MNSTATMAKDSNPDSIEADELYDVAKSLFDKATVARNKGDTDTSSRLLKAALHVMNDETVLPTKSRHASPETTRVLELLKEGWQEVAYLCEQTGLSVNRVHSILARLRRQQGVNVQAQAIKRYRISNKVDGA